MRKFMIKVNGKMYEVEAEEIIGNAPAAPVQAAQPVAAPAAQPVPQAAPSAPVAEPAPAAPAASVEGGTKIEAPMPGTINDIKVSVGETVKKGAILVILEAMKMENEILAPCDGVVASVNVTKGASVNTGDLLVSLN